MFVLHPKTGRKMRAWNTRNSKVLRVEWKVRANLLLFYYIYPIKKINFIEPKTASPAQCPRPNRRNDFTMRNTRGPPFKISRTEHRRLDASRPSSRFRPPATARAIWRRSSSSPSRLPRRRSSATSPGGRGTPPPNHRTRKAAWPPSPRGSRPAGAIPGGPVPATRRRPRAMPPSRAVFGPSFEPARRSIPRRRISTDPSLLTDRGRRGARSS